MYLSSISKIASLRQSQKPDDNTRFGSICQNVSENGTNQLSLHYRQATSRHLLCFLTVYTVYVWLAGCNNLGGAVNDLKRGYSYVGNPENLQGDKQSRL